MKEMHTDNVRKKIEHTITKYQSSIRSNTIFYYDLACLNVSRKWSISDIHELLGPILKKMCYLSGIYNTTPKCIRSLLKSTIHIDCAT